MFYHFYIVEKVEIVESVKTIEIVKAVAIVANFFSHIFILLGL